MQQKGEKMDPIIKNLYTREEIQRKIVEYEEKYEEYESKNDYELMTFIRSDIACFYEILEDKEKKNYHLQKIVDIWRTHPGKFVDWKCVSALRMLQKPEEALKIVLSNPRMWGVETLAHLYEELDRKEEAIIIYSGLASCSKKLSEACDPFWRPHYLREAGDLHEKAQDYEAAGTYNKRTKEEWEKIKNNIEQDLCLIEEAWLYEEVGYIYEKAGQPEISKEYYLKAQSKYEMAYTDEYLADTETHYVDGDWDKYYKFFIRQIPDFRLIYFLYEYCRENDYRRIKYRILNLEEQIKV